MREPKSQRYDHDRFTEFLNIIIRGSVKVLAALMTIVVLWSTLDVIYHLYSQLANSAISFFSSEVLVNVLGSFLAVLIAIEIFLNIIFFLREHTVHVPLVVATALTAAARKAIILDYINTPAIEVFALASVIFSLGVTYWLISKKI